MARITKLDAFVSDVFGSTVGDIIADPIKKKLGESIPEVFSGQGKKISTMVFGPTLIDERGFVAALVEIPKKREKQGDGTAIISKLLARIAELDTTELQDAFRQTTLQMKTGTEEPDPDKTAEVLIAITLLHDTDWENLKKSLNLENHAMPFDLNRECRRLEQKLSRIRATPRKLSFLQKFNFFSLSAPSLEE